MSTPTLIGRNRRHRVAYPMVVGDVDHVGGYPPARGLQFFTGGAGRVGIAIEERHMAALLRQALTDGGTDPAAGARYQRDFVC